MSRTEHYEKCTTSTHRLKLFPAVKTGPYDTNESIMSFKTLTDGPRYRAWLRRVKPYLADFVVDDRP
jgi:hypothetical protein